MKYFLIALFIILIFSIITTPKFKGMYGENRISNYLKKLSKKEKALLANNLILKDSKNNTFQIDHILFSKKGLFVVETKNYNGMIFGDDKNSEWTEVFNYGKQKYKFYSPVRQNETHIKRLKECINKDVRMINVVIFYKTDITNVNSCYTYSLNTFKKYYKALDELYSLDYMKTIYDDVLMLNNSLNIDIDDHINNINNKKEEYDNNVYNGICPLCKSKLVLRNGKYGEFYGCSNYPKCKFTKKN